MEKDSLGLIETLGLVAAVEAADAGSKAANVTFRGYESARAGLITVVFNGDVAAVRAAVTAGAAAAKQVGKVLSVHVIARPDRQMQAISKCEIAGAHQEASPPARSEVPKTSSAAPFLEKAPAPDIEVAQESGPGFSETTKVADREKENTAAHSQEVAVVAVAETVVPEPEIPVLKRERFRKTKKKKV